MVQAVEASLRRLNTDYIDLFYLHAWDGTADNLGALEVRIPDDALASGVLAGKYTRADLDHAGGSAEAIGTRRNLAAASGALSERGLAIADAVKTG